MEFLSLLFDFLWLIASYIITVIVYIFTYVPLLELFLGLVAGITFLPWISLIFPVDGRPPLGLFMVSILTGFATYHVGYPYAPNYVIGGFVVACLFLIIPFMVAKFLDKRNERKYWSSDEDPAYEASEKSQTEKMHARIRELENELKAQKSGENDPYKILGIKSSATLDEAVKTHRKLVRKYHPDLAATTTDEIQRLAEERLRQINDALDMIKKLKS